MIGGRRRAASVISVIALALGVVSASAAAPAANAFRDTTFFFRAQDGTIVTLLMLEFAPPPQRVGFVPGRGEPIYEGVASFKESKHKGQDASPATPRTVRLERSSGNPTDGKATYFGRIYLQAGQEYALRYVLEDEEREELFLKSTFVETPYLSGGLSTSSVVPAERYGPATSAAGMFQIGSEEVVPKAGGVFRRSEMLKLYLQVYDAKVDPETSQRRLDVSYRFYRVLEGASKRQGKPISVRAASGPSMGLSLPIGDWPTGSYRVVVELYDRVSSARTSTEGSFSVVDE